MKGGESPLKKDFYLRRVRVTKEQGRRLVRSRATFFFMLQNLWNIKLWYQNGSLQTPPGIGRRKPSFLNDGRAVLVSHQKEGKEVQHEKASVVGSEF